MGRTYSSRLKKVHFKLGKFRETLADGAQGPERDRGFKDLTPEENDSVGEYHEVHGMQNDVQQNYVVDSDAEYASGSNSILYEQYVKNNAEQEHFEGIQMALIKEVKEIFKPMEAEVEQHAVDKKCAEIKRKNLFIENENLLANCLSNEMFYSVTNDVNIVPRFSEMNDAYTIEQASNVELKAKISKLKHKIQKDYHSEMINGFSNLETSQDAPEFDSFFEINKMKEQLQGNDNTIDKLKIRRLKRMSLLLYELMLNWFMSRHAYLLGREIFSWIFKRCRRILSFVSQWTFCKTPTSSELSLHQLMFPQSIALWIIPKDSAHPFVPPPDGDLIIDFVNNLGYLEELYFVSKMHVNNLYQSWRTILSMINQCLTCKTSSSDKPRHPVLQMLWGVVTVHQVDHLLLEGRHNIHIRPQSPVHITADDYPLNNLKFVSKGEVSRVFRMPIPKGLITDAIWNSNYYKKYLEMAARKLRQPTTMTSEEVEKKKEALKAGKRADPLVDEKDKEGQPASEPQVEDDEYNLQRGIQMSLESLQAQDVEGNGKGIVSDEQAAQSLLNLQKPKKQNSTNDAETAADMEQSNNETDIEILNVVEERGKEVSNMVALEERTVKLDEGQAGLDLGKTPESQPPPELELMEEDQAGSKPRQSHDSFIFGDQFINDKSMEEESGKDNLETKVESMVTVPIHQASSSVPPLSTPIVDLSPPN
nr:hypothetical protein [Tanacetum cinerariifolium]